MANVKEIQDRIKSIQDTMKITNAMYMISSSKMKRAKTVLAQTVPYFFTVQSEISRILRHVPDIEHPYFDLRPEVPPEKRHIGLIVITGDKGMAGAYNHNVLKKAEELMAGPGNYKLYVLGMVGRMYFAKKQVDMDESFRYTVQKPTIHRARLITEKILEEFWNGNLDEVRVIYTQMVNAVTEETQVVDMLPLRKLTFDSAKVPVDMYQEEIMMQPSADVVLNSIVPNFLTGATYGTLVESYVSEHNARMMAMESSTNNAKEMLKQLSVEYNRARQAAITQEITEVIGGAKALKRK